MAPGADPAPRVVVEHLTGATIDGAPPCCVSCVWWQRRDGARTPDKRRWIDAVEESFGPWGKLYRDGDRLLAFLQYGPADAFARPRDVPAGPPTADAVLVTCAFLLDAGSPWALKSLFLACMGEVRDGGFPAVEAFAYRYDEGEGFPARFLEHRTIFPRDFLAEFGFHTVRTAGRVELMRLELGGLVPVDADPASVLARAWAGFRARRHAAAPAAP
jgi:hypothetical protein